MTTAKAATSRTATTAGRAQKKQNETDMNDGDRPAAGVGMPPLPTSATAILQTLRMTRSVERTAAKHGLPLSTVQRVAWMAFGLGELEVALVDF